MVIPATWVADKRLMPALIVAKKSGPSVTSPHFDKWQLVKCAEISELQSKNKTWPYAPLLDQRSLCRISWNQLQDPGIEVIWQNQESLTFSWRAEMDFAKYATLQVLYFIFALIWLNETLLNKHRASPHKNETTNSEEFTKSFHTGWKTLIHLGNLFWVGKNVHEFQGVWGVSKFSLELSINLPKFRLFGQIHNSTWQAFLIDLIELEWNEQVRALRQNERRQSRWEVGIFHERIAFTSQMVWKRNPTY